MGQLSAPKYLKFTDREICLIVDRTHGEYFEVDATNEKNADRQSAMDAVENLSKEAQVYLTCFSEGWTRDISEEIANKWLADDLKKDHFWTIPEDDGEYDEDADYNGIPEFVRQKASKEQLDYYLGCRGSNFGNGDPYDGMRTWHLAPYAGHSCIRGGGSF